MENITEKIDGYLREFNSQLEEPEEEITGIKPNELASLNGGIKRIQYRLNMAKTPQKYKDAFGLVVQLAEKYPMKQKLAAIMDTVADSYVARFGSTGA